MGQPISSEMGRNTRAQTQVQGMVGTVVRVSMRFLRCLQFLPRENPATREALTETAAGSMGASQDALRFLPFELAKVSTPGTRDFFLSVPSLLGDLPPGAQL